MNLIDEGIVTCHYLVIWREQGNEVAKLIARSWADEAFKARFMDNPVPSLREAGIDIPEGLNVEVVEGLDAPWKIVASEDAQTATYSINIPPQPEGMTEEDLNEAIAGTSSRYCGNCFCCV